MMILKKRHLALHQLLISLLPILSWLPKYQLSWLRADVMAGLAVWAMTVPQALAYAGIAGVPPIYGLYTVPLAMLAYAFLGTSRTLSVGPESAIAIISAVAVGSMAAGNTGEYLALTALLALTVGALFLMFGLLRLGWLSNFLSKPVLQGFTQGIALTVIVGVIPTILGSQAEYTQMVNEFKATVHTGFFLKAWAVLITMKHASLATTIVGLASLALLFALRRFRPHAPSALIAVVLSVIAVYLFGLAERGVDVIGQVKTGMVSLSLPEISLGKVIALMPSALTIVLLGYSVSLSVARVSAQATGEQIDSNQELVGLGVANLGAALSSGFVVCGSLSRGVVIRRAAGRTQVVSLINAALVILTLFLVLPLFFNLPFAALNAVVVNAMLGLLSYSYFKNLLKISRGEFIYAMAALFGVLILGILQGVALGVILSLVILIRRVSHPASAVLGRLPGTDSYRDITVRPEAETISGVLIYRFDAPIIFANAGYFTNQVRWLIAEAAEPVREVILPSQQINQIDSSGADQLAKLHAELKAKQITMSFAEAKYALRQTMSRTGLEEQIGPDRFYESIADAVQAFQQR